MKHLAQKLVNAAEMLLAVDTSEELGEKLTLTPKDVEGLVTDLTNAGRFIVDNAPSTLANIKRLEPLLSRAYVGADPNLEMGLPLVMVQDISESTQDVMASLAPEIRGEMNDFTISTPGLDDLLEYMILVPIISGLLRNTAAAFQESRSAIKQLAQLTREEGEEIKAPVRERGVGRTSSFRGAANFKIDLVNVSKVVPELTKHYKPEGDWFKKLEKRAKDTTKLLWQDLQHAVDDELVNSYQVDDKESLKHLLVYTLSGFALGKLEQIEKRTRSAASSFMRRFSKETQKERDLRAKESAEAAGVKTLDQLAEGK